jgi:hypothetical protein
MKIIYVILAAVCCFGSFQELKADMPSDSTASEINQNKLINLKNFANNVMPGWKLVFFQHQPSHHWLFRNAENISLSCTVEYERIEEDQIPFDKENGQKYAHDIFLEELYKHFEILCHTNAFPADILPVHEVVDFSKDLMNGFEIKKVQFYSHLARLNEYIYKYHSEFSNLIYPNEIGHIDYLIDIENTRFRVSFQGPTDVLNENQIDFDREVINLLSVIGDKK